MKQLTNSKKLLIKNIFCLSILVVGISISTSCLAQYNTNDAIFLQKLVDQDDPAAMQQLATMYHYGYGIESDQQKFKQLCAQSLDIYQQQAKQNNPKALYELGEIYSGRTYCASSNDKKASSYYQKAANLGNPKAQYKLAEENSLEFKRQHEDQAISKQCQKAINTYENLANKNNIEAQYELGKIYNSNLCMPRSDLKAFEWFQKAAENGHADAQYELSILYLHGLYLSEQNQKAYQDHTKYLKWFKKAADSGNSDAEYRFGRWYLTGSQRNQLPKDIPLGMRYLKNAALHNNHSAQVLLQYIYRDGQYSIPKDTEKFKKYYKLACATYYVRGCFDYRKPGDPCIPQ